MPEKKINITQKYNREILEIKNKLNQLEQGRIYELSRAQMDGYLATNIGQLKRMIAELIYKVEYGEESIEDNLRDIFDKKSI